MAPPRYSQQRKQRLPMSLRVVLFAAAFSFVITRHFEKTVFPHGAPVPIPMEDRIKYGAVDTSNDSLQAKHGKLTKIVERVPDGSEPLMIGPETVIVGKNNMLYTMTRDAKLLSITDFEKSTEKEHTMTAKVEFVADLGVGSPLGGKFTMDGRTLYVADPLQGLIRIHDPHNYPASKVELVANKVMDGGKLTRILFADDVAIGPKTGMVYFTDATNVTPDRLRDEGHIWDVMYASKVDVMRGKRTGRLLQYNPTTEEVTVLARNLFFANGVTVDADETFIFFAETFAMKLSKYNLQTGEIQVAVDSHQLPGMVDGTDCSWTKENKHCYAVIPTTIMPAFKVFQVLPPPIDQYLRALLMLLPKSMAPEVQPYGGVVEVHSQTGEVRLLQDPDATDLNLLTGVTAHDNKLYLGSIEHNVIGVYDLS